MKHFHTCLAEISPHLFSLQTKILLLIFLKAATGNFGLISDSGTQYIHFNGGVDEVSKSELSTFWGFLLTSFAESRTNQKIFRYCWFQKNSRRISVFWEKRNGDILAKHVGLCKEHSLAYVNAYYEWPILEQFALLLGSVAQFFLAQISHESWGISLFDEEPWSIGASTESMSLCKHSVSNKLFSPWGCEWLIGWIIVIIYKTQRVKEAFTPWIVYIKNIPLQRDCNSFETVCCTSIAWY